MKRVIAAVMGLVLALGPVTVAILAMRDAMRTVHTAVPPGARTEVEVAAMVREQRRDERRDLTEALVQTCRARVGTKLAPDGLAQTGPDRFRFTLVPGLDEFNRREMHGCLEDARMQHLQLDVLRLETVLPNAEDRSAGRNG